MKSITSCLCVRICSSSFASALLYTLRTLALTLLVTSDQVCFAQSGEQAKKIHATNNCKGLDLEKERYVVKSSRIEDPFDFLPWVRIKERRAADRIKALVDGKPYLNAAVIDKSLEIIENENFLPDTSDFRIRIAVEIISVENCSDHTVDVVYQVYSTQVLPVLSGVPEARLTERQAPQTAAGLSNVNAPAAKPVHLTPLAGYDSENKFFGGARLEITPKRLWNGPFNSIAVEGKGSSSMRFVEADLSGSSDPSGPLAHLEWRLNYTNYLLPTGAGDISGGHLSAQASAMTKPFANGNFTIRFGAMLEGGNRQSDLRNTQIAPNTVDSSAFGALKLYAGLNSRLPHNVFSVSYGLQMGAIGAAARVDWRKHLGDIRHEFWYPLGDHRILDLESRFTIGGIQVPGKIPISERFFGGANEEAFIPGESWQIRGNPVIRAIPGSRLFRTSDGAGGDRFFSYNLTAAYALWRQPLVTRELTGRDDFNAALNDSLNTITRNVKRIYLVKDLHYHNLSERLLPKVPSALDALKTAVQNAQSARPGQFTEQFNVCLRVINMAIRRTRSAVETMENYSKVVALLSVSADEDDNWLGKVIASVADLNASLQDPAITTASAALDLIRNDMEVEFRQIDQRKAQRLAEADLAFTRRTLHSLFNDVNIYSICPVFVFDVAKISPDKAGRGGVRYGPGAGLRLELATAAHFTFGYAWNIRAGLGEGSGTVFFSLGLRDIFH